MYDVCCLAGSPTLLINADDRVKCSLRRAIVAHDTPVLFDWLVERFNYQGVSDKAAASFIQNNALVRWCDLELLIFEDQHCAKLDSFWTFYNCRYDKMRQSCAQPALFEDCAVPRHTLRNGRLNQLVYSFYLFVRDVTADDIVGWIDEQIEMTASNSHGETIVGAFRGIFGVSDKVLAMALSDLLLAAPPQKERWHKAGYNLIAVDTLVHNFLHRTGILTAYEANHHYGQTCYGANGCAAVLHHLATLIDARDFNPHYPRQFARFVQHAIWRFCAADGLNVCNGNQIDDSAACQNAYCRLTARCRRCVLRPK